MVAVSFTLAAASPKVVAEEPASEFVRQLNAAGYHDVALAYLDRIAGSELVPADFRSAIEFEKAQVHVAAAQTARKADQLNERLEKAAQSLRAFIDAGEHPRRREAQLQLASLQKIRADRLLIGEVDDAIRKEAREAYLAASQTFTKITDAIREELKEMRGAKIDPSDSDAAAKRDRLRAEFLQGLVSNAEALKLAAETFPDPKKGQAKKLYDDAMKRFEELADKYADYVPGATAKLYVGEIKEKLGDTAPARAAYTEMLEAADADGLREAKFRAAAGLLRLAKSDNAAEVKAAIETAERLADDVRPNERTGAAANALQLSLAKKLIERSSGGGDGAKRSLSDGRKILNRIVKIPGSHTEAAKEMLSELGVSTEDAGELPTTADRPESTADAVVKARQFLDAINQSQSMLAELQKQTSEDAATQRQTIEAQMAENRELAASLLSQGLAMVNGETDSQTIVDARQLLAYVLSTGGRYRDAVVVGGSLARMSPGTAAGLSGGLMALGSLQNLLSTDPSNEGLINRLSSLADYLAATWPDDPKAQAAKSAVVQLSLQNSNFEKASTLIAAMDPSDEKASLQRLIGRMQYADAVAATREEDTQRAEQLRGDAAEHLKAGLSPIKAPPADPAVAKAALTLAKIQLQAGDSKAAVATIDHPKYGPAAIAEKIDPDPLFQSELYSTELRAVVGTMTGGGEVDASAALSRAIETMEKLQAANEGEKAAGRLQAIYMTMARDIREEIDAAEPARKNQLISAFRGFLDKMATSTEDASTLQWIGQTLMSLAEASMPPGQTVAAGDAATLLTSATDTFDRLVAKGGEPSLSVLFQQARALRMLGQYKQAIDTLEKILKQKPSMLDAQVEAALAYEQYATKVPEKYTDKVYASALSGARPGGPKNENVIWGWGKISILTQRNPQFEDKFFNARYHVALCRFLMGKAAGSDAIVRKAITDITQIAALYPKMGGPKQRKKFDDLLKQIQKEVGEETTGLGAVEKDG